VVVDPGVGTERAGLVLETSDQLVVAPDNGVISELMDRSGAGHCYSLDRPELGLEPRSRTFHGRDLFAPAAASLASGKVEPSACGEPLDPIWHRRCSLLLGERSVMGSVVSVDHFGNLITDISREYLPDSWPREVAVAIGSREIDAVVETYAQAEVGTLVALLGSGDRVEISRVEGSAAEFLDQRLGARVHLRW
jgi:S-adenosylmethionine hydrolase